MTSVISLPANRSTLHVSCDGWREKQTETSAEDNVEFTLRRVFAGNLGVHICTDTFILNYVITARLDDERGDFN